MTALPTEVQRLVDEANAGGAEPEEVESPQVIPPPSTTVELAGGYLSMDGTFVREAEVRELTGRDEEALARIKDIGRWMTAILERGTVRVGSDASSPGILDDLLAGDWETLLVAIRAVTFGNEYETETMCLSCEQQYSVKIDVTTDIPIRAAKEEDREFTVQGKRSVYTVQMRTGATQRKILENMSDLTTAELNTLVLFESITGINGKPPMSDEVVRDLPMLDRQNLLREISTRQAGPDMGGVRTKCPACGAEQNLALSVAALFQR